MDRLPQLKQSTDIGVIYVVKRGRAYKIGFTRHSLKRRVRACGGVLMLTIPTKQQPSALETVLHQRFASKRTTGPGFKREWFLLEDSDLEWLNGFASTISSGMVQPVDPCPIAQPVAA